MLLGEDDVDLTRIWRQVEVSTLRSFYIGAPLVCHFFDIFDQSRLLVRVPSYYALAVLCSFSSLFLFVEDLLRNR